MSTFITKVKGFADLYEPDSTAFTIMEDTARQVFKSYGYTELRIPILERTELFARSIGGETDVVQKEMYTFIDKGGRSLTMRPEATAGVMRAFIESGQANQPGIFKFFTFGPMFRYERPQKGRMRQFHQINCECLGPTEPYADAEVIIMLMDFLTKLGIKNLIVELNSLGCKECRPAYRDKLKAFLMSLPIEQLCEDCQRRMETNPMRILDCKIETRKELIKNSPVIMDHICPSCKEHFACVDEQLTTNGLKWRLNPRLVRGLDYYTRTTFEIVSSEIGAQGSVSGGGRYDGLINYLGGPDIPGVGFACGMERLAMLLPKKEIPRPDFYIAVVEETALSEAFRIAKNLRQAGFNGEMSFNARSLKSQLKTASRLNAKKCLVLGGNELQKSTIQIKDMDSGEQQEILQEELQTALKSV